MDPRPSNFRVESICCIQIVSTITLTHVEAATDATVQTAKIAASTGVVDNRQTTIKFTLPFGYKEKNHHCCTYHYI